MQNHQRRHNHHHHVHHDEPDALHRPDAKIFISMTIMMKMIIVMIELLFMLWMTMCPPSECASASEVSFLRFLRLKVTRALLVASEDI